MAAYQSRIPDVWLGEDGTLRIILEIDSAQIEGVYLSNQIALEDMFVQTASYSALLRHGADLGVDLITGTPSIGSVLFGGQGGIYIPTGTEIAFDPGGGQDILYFVTTQDGTIPNPGIPTAPVAVDGGAGALAAGTYEWVVAYVTSEGETLPSMPSNALILAANRQATVTIPLGGPGTTGRQVYRSLNNGAYGLVAQINDNTTTVITDDEASFINGEVPNTISTAQQILVTAQSEENGLEYNAVPGTITILVNAPDGITSVTNPNAFTGGSDEEDIEHYRTRLLNWMRSPQTGSTQDLINWAETVTGVDSASAFNNTDLNGNSAPGTVTIRIAGPNGTIPSADVITAVQTLLGGLDLANVTVLVGTFAATVESIAVTIFPATGFTTAQLAPTVQQAIIDYVNSIPVGGTLYISGIIDAVFGISGINDVTVQTPATNQTAASTAKFTTDTSHITVSGTP